MKITVLARTGASSAILLNWLTREGFRDLDVVLEAPPRRLDQVRQRARRFGWSRALGQVLFMGLVMPLLRRASVKRRRELLALYDLDARMPCLSRKLQVETINDAAVVDRLQSGCPDVVLVNGTSIIRAPVLRATEAPIVNTHVGITPTYRGVHGGYWALWNNEPQSFGVTLHLVNEGVDTGDVLAQLIAAPTPADNLASYPLLQQAVSFSALRELLETVQRGEVLLPLRSATGEGRQWAHPTLSQYALGRLRGVR